MIWRNKTKILLILRATNVPEFVKTLTGKGFEGKGNTIDNAENS